MDAQRWDEGYESSASGSARLGVPVLDSAQSYVQRPQTTVLAPVEERGPRRCPRRRRRWLQALWVGLDMLANVVVILVAAWVLGRYPSSSAWLLLGLMVAVRITAFVRLGMYRAVLRYSGIHTMVCTMVGVAIGSAVAMSSGLMLDLSNSAGLGRAFWVLEGMMALMVTGGMRMSARLLLERSANGEDPQRVLIYGAGSLGELALRDLKRAPGFVPVGFMDDDSSHHRNVIHGKPVLGGLDDFEAIVARGRPDLVVVAMAEPPQDMIRQLFRRAMARGIHVLLAKGVSTAFDDDAGHLHLGLRDMALEDLLRRPSRQLDDAPVQAMIHRHAVMITGAGGSIGSELCRQVARMGARSLHIVDHSEFALYQIHAELVEHWPELEVVPHLLSLLDAVATGAMMARAKPELVIHAAAYKHVPLVEDNPCTGVFNNVASFANVLRSATENQVGSLVLISTDKAVRPTNVMGASKRVCERLMQCAASEGAMRCCAVRFGNVLGSSGSVVPRFLDQIAAGGPVTVTHPDITRYFMLIPEAVSLVLQAAARSTRAGEIFILDMGEPVRIADLARQLIFMCGKRPDVDIAITYSGLRPGEKLYEELLINDSDCRTDVPDITVAAPMSVDCDHLRATVAQLLEACERYNYAGVHDQLQSLVPEWAPSREMIRMAAHRVEVGVA